MGVSPEANNLEIKTAYRKLIRELHPDRNSGKTNQEDLNLIFTAYEVLSKLHSRNLYDDYLFGATEIPIRKSEPTPTLRAKYRGVFLKTGSIIVLAIILQTTL